MLITECMKCKNDAVTCSKNKENLIIITVNITDLCNLRCEYCWHSKRIGDERRSSMSYQDIDLLLYDLKTVLKDNPVSLTFIGGEPLIQMEKIEYCIRELRKIRDNFHFKIITNGRCKTPEKIYNFLFRNRHNNVHLVVSLPTSIKELEEGYEYLEMYSEILQKFRITFTIVITERNINEMKELMTKYKELNLGKIIVNFEFDISESFKIHNKQKYETDFKDLYNHYIKNLRDKSFKIENFEWELKQRDIEEKATINDNSCLEVDYFKGYIYKYEHFSNCSEMTIEDILKLKPSINDDLLETCKDCSAIYICNLNKKTLYNNNLSTDVCIPYRALEKIKKGEI